MTAKRQTSTRAKSGGLGHASSESVTIWLVSESKELVQSIESLLTDDDMTVVEVGTEEIEQGKFRGRPAPGILLLDIEADMDRGLRVIRQIKRARLTAPTVVLTSAMSRDFGAKIISQGIRYYFPHDFYGPELLELVRTLVSIVQREHKEV